MARTKTFAPVAMVALLGLGMGLVGCTDDDGGDAAEEQPVQAASEEKTSAETQASQPDDSDWTEAELEDLLLTLDDLPTGWTVDPTSGDSGDDSTSSDAPACFQELEKVGDDRPSADVSFLGPTNGIPLLMESVGDLGPDAADTYDAAVAAFDSCDDISFTADGELVEGTMRAMSSADVGDESSAWRMSFDVQGFPFTFDVTVTRVGGLGVIVALGDLGSADPDLLDRATAEAVAKVEAGT